VSERRDSPEGPLESASHAPELAPEHEPPPTTAERDTAWVADHDTRSRDTRPAVGTRGQAAVWRRAVEGAQVALARGGFGDSRWSYLFKRDTGYASIEPEPGEVAEANRRMRAAPVPEVQGPFIKAPVWTWQVPLYFWIGGVASGSAFVAFACDASGDHRSAATARKVALAAVVPAPLLLIGDLGRPERFLNMLRIFKPRSPMNLGAWCLLAFSSLGAAAVGADVIRRPLAARRLGAINALLGGYLGSYTGVLLAATAVPLWARSRLFLGPIFVSTATATGAAATRLTLVVRGLPDKHPTHRALGTLETASMLTELALSSINERRLGRVARPTSVGRPGVLFRLAKGSVIGGLALRLLRGRLGPATHDVASFAYLLGGLAFRYAWVEAGKASAVDHEAAAATGRGRATWDDQLERPRGARAPSKVRAPLPLPGARRAWGEAVRRTSLAVERLVR
jgi:formate-dependent nitrite reductase membrane component NrfD